MQSTPTPNARDTIARVAGIIAGGFLMTILVATLALYKRKSPRKQDLLKTANTVAKGRSHQGFNGLIPFILPPASQNLEAPPKIHPGRFLNRFERYSVEVQIPGSSSRGRIDTTSNLRREVARLRREIGAIVINSYTSQSPPSYVSKLPS